MFDPGQSNTRKSPILYNTGRNLTVDINRKVGLVVYKGVPHSTATGTAETLEAN